MSYPLEVVAEKGTLQRTLGLTAIERTATADFPKGKVTIRTNKVPTPTEAGAYTLYYNAPNGFRAVCSVQKMRDWSQGYQNAGYTQEIYYAFTSGCIKSEHMDAFVETLKAIEAKVDALMRKESNGYQEEIS